MRADLHGLVLAELGTLLCLAPRHGTVKRLDRKRTDEMFFADKKSHELVRIETPKDYIISDYNSERSVWIKHENSERGFSDF